MDDVDYHDRCPRCLGRQHQPLTCEELAAPASDIQALVLALATAKGVSRETLAKLREVCAKCGIAKTQIVSCPPCGIDKWPAINRRLEDERRALHRHRLTPDDGEDMMGQVEWA